MVKDIFLFNSLNSLIIEFNESLTENPVPNSWFSVKFLYIMLPNCIVNESVHVHLTYCDATKNF